MVITEGRGAVAYFKAAGAEGSSVLGAGAQWRA